VKQRWIYTLTHNSLKSAIFYRKGSWSRYDEALIIRYLDHDWCQHETSIAIFPKLKSLQQPEWLIRPHLYYSIIWSGRV